MASLFWTECALTSFRPSNCVKSWWSASWITEDPFRRSSRGFVWRSASKTNANKWWNRSLIRCCQSATGYVSSNLHINWDDKISTLKRISDSLWTAWLVRPSVMPSQKASRGNDLLVYLCSSVQTYVEGRIQIFFGLKGNYHSLKNNLSFIPPTYSRQSHLRLPLHPRTTKKKMMTTTKTTKTTLPWWIPCQWRQSWAC